MGFGVGKVAVKQWVFAGLISLLIGACLFVAQDAFAGAGTGTDDEFEQIWTQLVGWTQGTLGRIISLSMILVGLVAGIANQSIFGVGVGVASGMALYNAADVIDVMMGAAMETTISVAPLASQIANGLM